MKRLLVVLLLLLPLVGMAQRKYNVWIASAPVVSTTIQVTGYALNKLDSLAGLDFTKPYTALSEVYILDSSNQKANFEVWLYRDRPDTTTLLSPFVLKNVDHAKVCGVVNVPTTAYYSGAATPAMANGTVVLSPEMPVRLSTTRRYMYYKLVVRGTPTYTSGTALKLVFCFTQM